MIRAQSVYNLLNKKVDELPFTGEWHEAFSCPEPTGIWLVYGNSGSGKTSFLLQLARYFSEELSMRVAFQSMEESGRSSFQRSIRRAGWKEKGGNIQVLPEANPTEVDEWLELHPKTKVVIIDTVQYWILRYQFSIEQYFELKKKYTDKLFIYNSHINGNEPDTRTAIQIMRDADQKVFINGFRAFSKGRHIGSKGHYSIWPDKEKTVWLSDKQ